MTLPHKARVQPAQNFLDNLDDAHAFFMRQDADTANVRMETLRKQLREMVEILRWSPGSGRPARFMLSESAQAQLRLEQVRQLAEQTGLPTVREFIVAQFVVLYAHSETQVVLLSMRHQRQLTYNVIQ